MFFNINAELKKNFGFSLFSYDLNYDKYDDLVVTAPFGEQGGQGMLNLKIYGSYLRLSGLISFKNGINFL